MKKQTSLDIDYSLNSRHPVRLVLQNFSNLQKLDDIIQINIYARTRTKNKKT